MILKCTRWTLLISVFERYFTLLSFALLSYNTRERLCHSLHLTLTLTIIFNLIFIPHFTLILIISLFQPYFYAHLPIDRWQASKIASKSSFPAVMKIGLSSTASHTDFGEVRKQIPNMLIGIKNKWIHGTTTLVSGISYMVRSLCIYW